MMSDQDEIAPFKRMTMMGEIWNGRMVLATSLMSKQFASVRVCFILFAICINDYRFYRFYFKG
jgi:hypothetical protein